MTLALAEIRFLILDMDGVLYRGNQALPGGREFLAWLDERGVKYLMLTNNSVRTPRGWSEKLAAMGMAVSGDRIMTAAQATAAHLRKLAPQGATVYIIGGRGLSEAVLDDSGGRFELDERHPDFVLVGLDPEFTYEKMKRGCQAIRAGARFIASNPDTTFPVEDGIAPGAGAIVASLVACTSVQPLVIGKPELVAFELALERLGADRGATAMLGDRLDTDILGGQRAGLTTLMVLTGISTPEELASCSRKPDYTFAGLPDLMAAWQGDARSREQCAA
jgi:4-nitrophenyl phosphatase